jgi:hypothetical protein
MSRRKRTTAEPLNPSLAYLLSLPPETLATLVELLVTIQDPALPMRIWRMVTARKMMTRESLTTGRKMMGPGRHRPG